MTKKGWGVAIGGVLAAVLLSASSCDSPTEDKAMDIRNDKASSNVLCGEKGESLECRNLREKEKRNSDPNRIGYVYLYNFDGSIKGYFVVKGKVSSNQSQMGPADILYKHSYGNVTLEAAGDDGTYGPNEDGIFFFLESSGIMVTYSGEYVLSDGPLKLKTKDGEDAPKLG